MECPKCHAENNVGSRFCSNCAAPLNRSRSPTIFLTKTMEAPAQAFIKGILVAGKYPGTSSSGNAWSGWTTTSGR